jgi:perosamine synthetase
MPLVARVLPKLGNAPPSPTVGEEPDGHAGRRAIRPDSCTTRAVSLRVPYFRPSIGQAEIDEVVGVLRSGWCTTGPQVRRFERMFADAVGATHAIAVNSATAALHLAVEALGLQPGQAVLVPTMTFAATAEVVRYMGATPVPVDAEPRTLNLDYGDAARKLDAVRSGRLPGVPAADIVGVIPVHVGGFMVDVARTRDFASAYGLWVVDDAAHALPAAWRCHERAPWVRCGERTSQIACFSFYANKTITTGEGGMAVTDDPALAERMRLMSLHGLSRDAWDRYTTGGQWDYRIIAPGYKYNMTDVAAAMGIHQLAQAEALCAGRRAVAERYLRDLQDVPAVELPADDVNRRHAWHLFPIRLVSERLTIERNAFITALNEAGIGTSVHWRPLHLHPYYRETYGWTPGDCPVASREWQRLVSLPIYPSMSEDEQSVVIDTVRRLCREHAAQ